MSRTRGKNPLKTQQFNNRYYNPLGSDFAARAPVGATYADMSLLEMQKLLKSTTGAARIDLLLAIDNRKTERDIEQARRNSR
ncbi:MAG: hypothetical protein FWD15_00755 [Alphaproteobacteria bacterium]|nr:hypothetical protein [Alphaproteobacteria bacterium]